MPRVIHFEILSDSPEPLADFYAAVFGWHVHKGTAPQAYWPVSTGPREQPGIDGGFMHRHLPQAVINTIQVESVDAVVEQITAQGGAVALGPRDVPGVGRHAYCKDPQGNLFGVLQPV